MFKFSTGKHILTFGGDGSRAGDIGGACASVRFTPGGETLLVAEFSNRRLSMFAVDGTFVKFIGEGLLGMGWNDLAFTCTGNVIVADVSNHRMVLLDPNADASDQCVNIWGSVGSEPGQLRSPTAMAVVGSHLYVLDACAQSPRVQVFA